jgi:hypothetical protein
VQIKSHIVHYNLFQYAKQKYVEMDVPAIKLAKTDDEVTKEIIETSLPPSPHSIFKSPGT